MSGRVTHISLGLILLLAFAMLLFAAQSSAAQCVENPTGETAVGLQNSTSYFLTFYIDGRNMGGVPAGDKSVDFNVTAGQHTLRADAQVGDRTLTVSRVADIPSGYVCTWTVINQERAERAQVLGRVFKGRQPTTGRESTSGR